MAEYLTPEEYKTLLSDIGNGDASLLVSRNLARQFFFNVGNRNIRDLTGISMTGRKTAVVALLFLSLGLAALCLALVVREFGWWAMIGGPLVGIFWTVFAGFTTEMGNYLTTFAWMTAAVIIGWFLPPEYRITLLTFAASMFTYQLAHLIAETFLLQLLQSSYDAYDMLCEQIELEHHAA